MGPPWHTSHVTEVLPGDHQAVLGNLTESERRQAIDSESLWRRAHQIAGRRPGVDPGDVYHALRCLALAPTERLRRGLSRGRLCTHAR